MKKRTYKKNNGEEGYELTLEKGDVFTPKFGQTRKTKIGDFDKYSILGEIDGKEEYIKITPGQAKWIEKAGDVTGIELEAVEYSGPQGKTLIGLKRKTNQTPNEEKTTE